MKQKSKKTIFYCQQCGYESTKWLGQCPACKEWNTFVEEVVDKKSISSSGKINTSVKRETQTYVLNEIKIDEQERMMTGMKELDRVLGGGIVKGSLTLIGGDPGIGKSTLLLQVCRNLSSQGENVLYVSGEESPQQIKIRADRIGKFTNELKLFCETNLSTIRATIEKEKPSVVIIDSIQTMYDENVTSTPGSVSQVREATAVLMQIAKGMNISMFIVGHVTKEGSVAGP